MTSDTPSIELVFTDNQTVVVPNGDKFDIHRHHVITSVIVKPCAAIGMLNNTLDVGVRFIVHGKQEAEDRTQVKTDNLEQLGRGPAAVQRYVFGRRRSPIATPNCGSFTASKINTDWESSESC